MEFQLTDLIDGQYKVVEKHRGGMSIVYIVLDEFSQKRFAIKTIKEELLEDRSSEDPVEELTNRDLRDMIMKGLLISLGPFRRIGNSGILGS